MDDDFFMDFQLFSNRFFQRKSIILLSKMSDALELFTRLKKKKTYSSPECLDESDTTVQLQLHTQYSYVPVSLIVMIILFDQFIPVLVPLTQCVLLLLYVDVFTIIGNLTTNVTQIMKTSYLLSDKKFSFS